MEHISTTTLFVVLFLLIVISAFFSSSETSMIALNRARLKVLAKNGDKRARLTMQLLSRLEELVGAILLGNNMVNILAAAIATMIALRVWGEGSVALSSLLLTVVILIFAEVTPKTFAAKYPEKIALPVSGLIAWFIKIFKPLIWLINLASGVVLSLFRIKSSQDDNHLSRNELQMIVNEAGGFISSNYQTMLLNIIDLEKVTVNDLMIPKNELVGIDINDEAAILTQLASTQHTRLLVFDGSENNIIGTLHMRDLVHLYATNSFAIDAIKKAIRNPYYVLEKTSLSQQLINFQKEKRRLSLVVDEYGSVQGMIVLEDILEEIVGNFTSNLSEQFNEIIKQSDGSYFIDARLNIREVNKHLSINIPSESAQTINGLILEHLEDIPAKDVSLKIGNYLFHILQASKYGVRLVKLTIEKE